MQQEILEKNPSVDLQVYVVWTTVLTGDGRSTWDPNLMPDPRVIHFWDTQTQTPIWFGEHLAGRSSFAWDVYYLFGPDAEWDSVPEPLISTFSPVVGGKQAFQDDLSTLLEN